MWDQKRTPSPAAQQLRKVSGGSMLGWQGRHMSKNITVALIKCPRDAGPVRNKHLLREEGGDGATGIRRS